MDGRHMSFSRTEATLRTDADFRLRSYEDYHRENSPIEKLDINMVQHFPVADDLHLLYLGIMKKSLNSRMFGTHSFKTKLSGKQIVQMSEILVRFKMPTEIHRSVRGLDCISFWKGTEFRTFLLY